MIYPRRPKRNSADLPVDRRPPPFDTPSVPLGVWVLVASLALAAAGILIGLALR